MLLIAACSTLASVMAVTAATYKILSTDHRLRAGLLLPRADRRVGSVAWFQAEAEQVNLHLCWCRIQERLLSMSVGSVAERTQRLLSRCTFCCRLAVSATQVTEAFELATQARLRIRSGWRKAAARVRVVMAHGAGHGGRDWLRRSFSRGRQRRGGEDTDDGASMSSRLREVVMGERSVRLFARRKCAFFTCPIIQTPRAAVADKRLAAFIFVCLSEHDRNTLCPVLQAPATRMHTRR